MEIGVSYPTTPKKAPNQVQQAAWKAEVEAGFCDPSREALGRVVNGPGFLIEYRVCILERACRESKDLIKAKRYLDQSGLIFFCS